MGWRGEEQETLVPQVLGFSTPERKQFLTLLAKARAAEPLEFKDIFTRDALRRLSLVAALRET